MDKEKYKKLIQKLKDVYSVKTQLWDIVEILEKEDRGLSDDEKESLHQALDTIENVDDIIKDIKKLI